MNKRYIFENKKTHRYWVDKGITTDNKALASVYDEEKAARIFRNMTHKNEWLKVEI